MNYIDLSPAAHIDPASSEVDFLDSVALTRAGAVEGLSFYSVDTNGGSEMDWKKWLLTLLGMPEATSDEDLAAAFEAKMKSLATEAAAAATEPVASDVAAMSAQVATIGQSSPILTALSAEVETLKGSVLSFQAALDTRDRAAIVAQAAREGKVIPLSAEQIAASDLTVLSEMVGKLPVTVPIDRRTPAHVHAMSADAVSPAVEAIARKCGLDPAKVMEVNKKG